MFFNEINYSSIGNNVRFMQDIYPTLLSPSCKIYDCTLNKLMVFVRVIQKRCDFHVHLLISRRCASVPVRECNVI